MNGWMDAWMNELMDGWIHASMNGWMDGWMDAWMDCPIARELYIGGLPPGTQPPVLQVRVQS